MLTIAELRAHAHAFAAETKQEFHHFVDYVERKENERPVSTQDDPKLVLTELPQNFDLTQGGSGVASDSAIRAVIGAGPALGESATGDDSVSGALAQ